MKIKAPFVLRNEPTEQVKGLLTSVTLGTNGAKYRHLDTLKRLKQLYKPLYLNLERRERTLGNITFCRRPCGWYVRYFAFDVKTQSEGKVKSSVSKTESFLKQIILDFFNERLGETNSDTEARLFYAYIEPKNLRSLWMSQNFGFKTVAKIATQTFSRVQPRFQKNVRKIEASELNLVKKLVEENYAHYALYFTHHTFNENPFYGYYDENNELIAFAKAHKTSWVIERMPGKSGGLLKNIIPFVPRLRRLINPSKQTFTVLEAIWHKKGKTEEVNNLFEGILNLEKTNTALWWVDLNDPVYKNLKNKVNWGLVNKINGVSEVDLVVLSKTKEKNEVYYTTAMDFI